MLNFAAIRWSFSPENIPLLNKLHETLISLGYNENILQTSDDISMRIQQYKLPAVKLPTQVSYLSVLPLHNLWRMCKKIGSLKLRNPKTVKILEEIEIPVHELKFDSDKAIEKLILGNFNINTAIVDSVQTVSLNLLEIGKGYLERLQGTIEDIITIFEQRE